MLLPISLTFPKTLFKLPHPLKNPLPNWKGLFISFANLMYFNEFISLTFSPEEVKELNDDKSSTLSPLYCKTSAVSPNLNASKLIEFVMSMDSIFVTLSLVGIMIGLLVLRLVNTSFVNFGQSIIDICKSSFVQ